ncbi:hypothetical protein BDZ97DRAFT_1762501 [Flammula alnicola]|nr:hypothetical protein BDZ97DRAFT_1762501 [Flammula alnicola]
MENSSASFSLPSLPSDISEFPNDEISFSLTTPSSPTSASFGSSMAVEPELVRTAEEEDRLPLQLSTGDGMLADDGMMASARTLLPFATMPTSARSVAMPATYPLSVDLVPQFANKRRSQFDFWSSRPSYARSFMWSDDGGVCVTLAKASETLLPLPLVPQHELDNERATATITNNPHLFKIISPVVVTSRR